MYKVTAYFKNHKVIKKFHSLYDAVDFRDLVDANYPIKVTFEKVKYMSNNVTPIGWARTLLGAKDAWKSIMTIKNSPLRNLPPQLGLMVFSILSIMWSGIFAAIINNPYAFGISAGGHLLVVFGIFITAIVYDSAEKYSAPQNYNIRGNGGEHE